MHALLAAAVLVTGLVTTDDAPLPGCTVTLTSAAYSATRISDADGKYAFDAVPPGSYEITLELAGLRTERRAMTVRGDENVFATEDLEVEAITETIVMACGSPCTSDRPSNRWERPACADYDLDTALIDAMKGSDRSARDLLVQRYANTDTWSERHRIGGALLNRVPNDSAIWSELLEHATIAVRFPSGEEPEFSQWCEERGLDPYNYWSMAYDGLTVAAEDPRSRPLLLDALKTDEMALIYTAIVGLAEQHDESSLAAIEQTLERRRDEDVGFLAQGLALFKSERADALAMKYIAEDDERVSYFVLREQVP